MGKEAVQWVEEESRARGTEWTLLWAMAKRAMGCIAQMTADQAIKEGRLSRSELYRALRRLESLGELERLSQNGERKRVRVFHLRGIHLSQGFAVFSPVCPRKQTPIPDLKDRRRVETGGKQEAENCCLCRGTNWKLVPRPDGTGQMAVKCDRHVMQLPLLSIPEKNWVPEITRQMLEWRSRQWLRGTPLFGAGGQQ